jgi:hypothetical protein
MREKPILFSALMVQAILAGKKTQTRRVIKPQPVTNGPWIEWKGASWTDAWTPAPIWVMAPYQVDDLLWVRETWRVAAWREEDGIQVEYRADASCSHWIQPPEEQFDDLWEQSTNDAIVAGLATDENGDYSWGRDECPTRWRPSIFMPRWASRLTLRVTNVRAERLQDISHADICAELGCESEYSGPGPAPYQRDLHGAFANLWNFINAKRGFSWASNPWVFAYTFDQVTP